ncbi:hypothetical protein [Caldimonas manganoxidans]|uniref:hypothetical protein n=1 Tax=Caldimonas manganoxidans TaxID=196015 RepID=UPI0012EAA6C6|nr:hypothetical protein [Caldimonas manganoxidans]
MASSWGRGSGRGPWWIAGVIVLGGVVALGGWLSRTGPQWQAGDEATKALSPQEREALEAAGQRLAQALRNRDRAWREGGAAAMEQAQRALNEVMGLGTRPTLRPEQIEAVLPAQLGGLPRQPSDTFGDASLGASSVSVSTQYGDDAARRIVLSVSDTGGLSVWAVMAEWLRVAAEAQQAGRREIVRFEQGRVRREVEPADATPAQIHWVLANGVAVEALADGLDLDGLRAAMKDLDLAALEGLRP